MSSTRPALGLASSSPQKGVAHDYRLMVEAVETGDLAAARNAYGRMLERLNTVGVGADDTLAKIGSSLRQGDLAAARRVLERLESKALQVLRGLREHADFAPTDAALPLASRKSH